MTDIQRELSIGEQQITRRGTPGPDGWVNRTPVNLAEGQKATYTGGAMPTRRRPRGSGGPTTPPPPPPPDPPPAVEPAGVQGYARVWMLANGKSGGSKSVDDIHTPADDADVFVCGTYGQIMDALLNHSGKRFVKVVGSDLLDGAGADDKIIHDTFTVDFSFYTGPDMKDYKLLSKVGNQIWTQGGLRPGEGSTTAKSADRRGISFNPGNDGTVIHGICLDHMSVGGGPDVAGSFINNCEDCTVQYSFIAPALYKSNLHPTGTGYGWNNTTPGNSDPSTIYTKRLTFYRGLSALCRQRNLKAEHTDGYDAVNWVVYGYGNQCPVHGNFRGGNIVGCIFKKSPDSQSSNKVFEADDGGAHPYDQYDDSTYHDDCVLWEENGDPLTADWSDVDAAALRATPYANGPTHASHGALSVAAADAALFADVVANAGRTHESALDLEIKAHVLAGTTDGFYSAPSYPAPHLSWAA